MEIAEALRRSPSIQGKKILSHSDSTAATSAGAGNRVQVLYDGKNPRVQAGEEKLRRTELLQLARVCYIQSVLKPMARRVLVALCPPQGEENAPLHRKELVAALAQNGKHLFRSRF